MNEEGEDSLQVRHFYQKAKIPLELRPVSGRTGFLRSIGAPSVSKGSLSGCVWGRSEILEIEGMSPVRRKEFVGKRLQVLPFLILSDGLSYPRTVKQMAKEKRTALFVTELSKGKSKTRLRKIFGADESPEHVLSGGLLSIFSRGVFITGDSGVGKSECALELISRGHLFVSDDVIRVRKAPNGKLVGSAPPLSRNFMEIRGLGIININKIFGAKSTCPEANIDLVIKLKRWKPGKEYDRLGLKFPGSQRILGVDVPKISIPVAPGRNITTLIEVACKVFLLKQKGYHAARELSKKLDRALAIR